jgi:hypothetical protein
MGLSGGENVAVYGWGTRAAVAALVAALAGSAAVRASDTPVLTLDPFADAGTWPALDAADAGKPDVDLTLLPLEDLMNLQVYSVSKQAQRLSDAPAAVYVITQDDIHRSGATTIAEVAGAGRSRGAVRVGPVGDRVARA